MNKLRQITFVIKKIFKCLIACLVYVSLVVVACIVYSTYTSLDISINDKYMIYITAIMSIGILIAYRQIVSSTDLARRQLSMTESIRILGELREKRQKLEASSKMDYAQELQKGTSIPYTTIHEWICEKENGCFVGESGQYRLSQEGKDIKNNIRAIINIYEYLAIGVLNNVFDEDILKDGFDYMSKNIYVSFENYIKHIRTSEDSKDFAVNFEWLNYRWNKDKNSIFTRD
jgi:hypothetical protein